MEPNRKKSSIDGFELISRFLEEWDSYRNFPLKRCSPTIGTFEHFEKSKKRKMFDI